MQAVVPCPQECKQSTSAWVGPEAAGLSGQAEPLSEPGPASYITWTVKTPLTRAEDDCSAQHW